MSEVSLTPIETALSRALRRCVTIPAVLAATLASTAALPVVMPVALLVSATAAGRGAARTTAFVVWFLWCETMGIVISAWLWCRYLAPNPQRRSWAAFLDANYRLQCAWSNALARGAERLFQLEMKVHNEAALDGPPALMMARHASMADTLIPMVFYAIPRGVRLRYVLKRELLLDPCLDIVGNRLPNCFVDRFADDPGPEVARVAALARDLTPEEGVLIFPEGTRFSPARRERALARLATSVDEQTLARMASWTDLLPPRLGGPLALLEANPGRDLVFCVHTGFEGSSHFGNLVNGSWMRALVRIAFWRVPFAEIPRTSEARRELLLSAWDRMQRAIDEMKAGAPLPVGKSAASIPTQPVVNG